MAARFLVVVALFATVPKCKAAIQTCAQRASPDFRADPSDCSKFHMCSMGTLVELACPSQAVFDDVTHSCVPKFSPFDRCSRREEPKGPCNGKTGRVPDPAHCARYFECGAGPSGAGPRLANQRGGAERECPYPHVFSRGHCVMPAPGICGSRLEPLDQCDYKSHQCTEHSNCVPCHVRYPSCRGLPDGMNAWAGREGSPYYVTCRAQRVLTSHMCQQKDAVVIFDTERRECVKREEKPPRQPIFNAQRPASTLQHSGVNNGHVTPAPYRRPSRLQGPNLSAFPNNFIPGHSAAQSARNPFTSFIPNNAHNQNGPNNAHNQNGPNNAHNQNGPNNAHNQNGGLDQNKNPDGNVNSRQHSAQAAPFRGVFNQRHHPDNPYRNPYQYNANRYQNGASPYQPAASPYGQSPPSPYQGSHNNLAGNPASRLQSYYNSQRKPASDSDVKYVWI